MVGGFQRFESSVHAGAGAPFARTAEERGSATAVADAVIVSSDSHWSLSEDIFYQRFPAHLRDRAPRLVTVDGVGDWLVNGKSFLMGPLRQIAKEFEAVPGCLDLDARLRDLDTEGIDKEIVFPNGLAGFYGFPDLEVREWVARTYNQYLSEMQLRAPGRFYGVGQINFWDQSKTRESLAELKALGIKTFVIPQSPYGADMQPLNYCDPAMDYLWAAIEEAGLPFCFHVGEGFMDGGPGGVGTYAMVGFSPYRKIFAQLVFGGILDRFPGLRVVFVEGDINWVPGALQTGDMIFNTYRSTLNPLIEHHPAYYWETNCYATFMTDPAGLRLIDQIGADTVMWCSDYPHPESVYGAGWSSRQEVIAAVSEEDARKILGETALSLFALQ